MKLKYVLIGIFAISLASNSLAMEKNPFATKKSETEIIINNNAKILRTLNALQITGKKLSKEDFNSITQQVKLLGRVNNIVPGLFKKTRLETLKDRFETAAINDQPCVIVIDSNNVRIITGTEKQNSKDFHSSILSVTNNFSNTGTFLYDLNNNLKANHVTGVTINNDTLNIVGNICNYCFCFIKSNICRNQ